eukprot:3748609-Pleurochrysis_carterae.AAC.1
MGKAGPSRTQLTSTSLAGMLQASSASRRRSRAQRSLSIGAGTGTAAESVSPPPSVIWLQSFGVRTGGIIRRFFHILPVKGPIAVNRRIPAVATRAQSSRFHSVVDIGHPLLVRRRGRSCHACDRCWSGKAAFPPLKGFKQDAKRPVCPQNVLAGHSVDRN